MSATKKPNVVEKEKPKPFDASKTPKAREAAQQKKAEDFWQGRKPAYKDGGIVKKKK